MKMTKLGAIALLMLCGAREASAFTLDFASFKAGDVLPGSPAAVNVTVPGYGDIALSSGYGSNLEIASYAWVGGTVNAVNMNNSESLVVTFLGATPEDVAFAYVGLGQGENFTSISPLGPNQFFVNFSGQGAGVAGATFTVKAVPEPSSLVLGCALGTAALFVRRRR